MTLERNKKAPPFFLLRALSHNTDIFLLVYFHAEALNARHTAASRGIGVQSGCRKMGRRLCRLRGNTPAG